MYKVRGSMGPPPPLLPLPPPPALLVLLPPDTAAVVTTVTCEEPDFVESAAEVAVTSTVPEGTVIGAVYTPDAEIMPNAELPPATPLTDQLTAVFEDPVTAAMNV